MQQKKLIIIGTNSTDLTGTKTIGEDNGELPNLESIELKNITEVPHYLFYELGDTYNSWL